MRGDECHRQVKLVPRKMKKHMHNEKKASNIKTLEECLLQVKGFKLQRKNGTILSDDENEDEGLYNELKSWKPASGSKARARQMKI